MIRYCSVSEFSLKLSVGFEPNATMHTAHHMLLFGCSTPGSKLPVWWAYLPFNNFLGNQYPEHHHRLKLKYVSNTGIAVKCQRLPLQKCQAPALVALERRWVHFKAHARADQIHIFLLSSVNRLFTRGLWMHQNCNYPLTLASKWEKIQTFSI